jgi:pimeloyl-ACP methyl ester carboxylesterase
MSLAYREYPIYFSAGEETLLGVLTEPAEPSNGVDILTLCGGGWIPGFHRGSMWVRLARAFAEVGDRTFRFDYHGVGESTGTVFFDMNLPLIQDAEAALYVLTQGSLDRSVLVGTCGGGRTAAALAAKVRPCGAVFLAVPVLGAKSTAELIIKAGSRRVLRNVFKSAHRRQYRRIAVRRIRRIRNSFRARKVDGFEGKRQFADDFEVLVHKRVRSLFVYGDEDPEYQQFLDASRAGRMARALERAGDLVEVVVVPGRLHGFATPEAQQHVIDVVRTWLDAGSFTNSGAAQGRI